MGDAPGRQRRFLLPYTTHVDATTIIVTLGSQPGAALGILGDRRRGSASSIPPRLRAAIRTIEIRRWSAHRPVIGAAHRSARP